MNEIKESTIVPYVDAKAHDGKMGWIMITNKTVGVISNQKKFSFIDFVLTDKVFQVNQVSQNRPVANRVVDEFRSQPREMKLLKPLNM